VRRRWREARALGRIVLSELIRTRVLDVAGGVAFWLMMSMVPLLMTAVALLGLLHQPGLVPQLLAIVALMVPPGALEMMERLIGHLLQPPDGALSFGVVSYLWSSTSGFTSLIGALNIAYDVRVERSWFHDRVRAFLMTFTSGGLLLVSLVALIAGPEVLHVVAQLVPVSEAVRRLWPLIRYGTIFVCFVLSLELIYFLGPNMRQRFRSTLPGAVVATGLWFAGSFALSFYLDHFAHYSRLYGGMGALFGLMFWIYLTALVLLVGAELNAEIAKRRDALFRGHLKATWKEAAGTGRTAA